MSEESKERRRRQHNWAVNLTAAVVGACVAVGLGWWIAQLNGEGHEEDNGASKKIAKSHRGEPRADYLDALTLIANGVLRDEGCASVTVTLQDLTESPTHVDDLHGIVLSVRAAFMHAGSRETQIVEGNGLDQAVDRARSAARDKLEQRLRAWVNTLASRC